MIVSHLRTCGLKNPLGFDLEPLSLSWCVSDTPSKTAVSSRIEISTDEDFQTHAFDSGFCEADSRAYRPGFLPEPYTRYYWRVTVRGDKGDTARSVAARFDAGIPASDLSGEYITSDGAEFAYFRKTFKVEPNARRAYLRAEGCGSVEMNGAAPLRCGSMYDVGSLLVEGNNAVCITAKSGVSCDILVVYDDGVENVAVGSWKWRQCGANTGGGVEELDARLAVKGRAGALLDDSDWLPATVGTVKPNAAANNMQRTARLAIKPKRVISAPDGDAVLDMGQSVAGYVEFINPLAADEVLTLAFSDAPDCDSLPQFTYISDGSPEVVRPLFSLYTFRYVRVTGWPGLPLCDDFSAHIVTVDAAEIGSVETANDEMNTLIKNAQIAVRGAFCTSAPDVFLAPSTLYGYDCGAVWSRSRLEGVARVAVPWSAYLFNGDTAGLERSFNDMREYVDGLKKGGGRLAVADSDGRTESEGLYCDTESGTDPVFCASAHYYYAAATVAKAASVLELDAAIEYKCLAGEVLEAIRHEFFSPSGRLCIATQTAHALSLCLGLSPEPRRTAEDLVRLVEQSRGRPETGSVGTPWILRALVEAGSPQLACSLAPKTGIAMLEWLYSCVCGLSPQSAGFKTAHIAPRPDRRLGAAGCELLTTMGLYRSAWRYREDELEVTVTVPFGATATVLLPLAVQGDVVAAASVRLRQKGENVECELAAGEYTFSYTPIAVDDE